MGVAVTVAAVEGGTIPAIKIIGNFAFYAAIAGVLVAAMGAWWRAGRAVAAALMGAVASAAVVASTAVGPPPPGEGAQTAKVLVFNIRWNNARLDDVVALALRTDPDVIVLNEIYWRNRPGLSALDAQYPYRLDCWRTKICDVLILSRKRLREPFIATRWNEVQVGFARVEFDVGSCPVTMFATHLNRPWPYHRLGSDAAQYKQAAALADAVREWPGAKMVVGDLNAATWTPPVRALAAAVGGRAMTGWSGTWPYFLPGVLKLPIDHVIVSQPEISAKRDVLDTTGSDHSPVLVTLAAECGR
jgi:endonuclease/exonuclease/phosphatase (EEP) superfamily protein YafD